MPPEWWREYRRRRQEHLREYNRQRRQTPKLKAQRRASEQRRLAKKRPPPCPDPLPPLYPSLQVGKYLSFWEDELRLDLAQEAWLAVLEGNDPEEAVARYRRREINWKHHTGPFLLDDRGDID